MESLLGSNHRNFRNPSTIKLIIFIPFGVGDALVTVMALMLDIGALLAVFGFLCQWNTEPLHCMFVSKWCVYFYDDKLVKLVGVTALCFHIDQTLNECNALLYVATREYVVMFTSGVASVLPICFASIYIKFQLININWDKCYFSTSLYPINYSKWICNSTQVFYDTI